ncbi:Armadillo repeat-containing protein 7 [Camellia lanceoleosa]|uniref:Armadillo repeat-containing protein 7 n=1 Tax=Camellia lanceoleosa TaxID=1840588 RepID=A0ACC0GAH9_9ERIC|nr:Armadillo repeat-containing protein 7 [Camellia lanceoleosa]
MLNSLFYVHQKRQEGRTGKYGTPRLHYQQELVSQFQNATSEELKEKIVANLANFTYDPFNYTFLHQLNIFELFLDCIMEIMEPNEKIVKFGIGGIGKSCNDPTNAALVAQCGGIPLIIQFLSSPVRNIATEKLVNYALGIMYYICNASNKGKILKPEVVDVIRRYAAADSVGVSFSNIAHALLDKHVYKRE